MLLLALASGSAVLFQPNAGLQRFSVTVATSLRASGLTPEDAARWMDLPVSVLYQQLRGEVHLSPRRLLMLPPMFWGALNQEGGVRAAVPEVPPVTVGFQPGAKGLPRVKNHDGEPCETNRRHQR
jgi:hypothetical protein